MRIALSVITKGDSELERLKKCIASFYPYVDKIFITANGEETRVTENWCRGDKEKIVYSYLAWDDDFSKQRNFNLEQIRREGFDWFVWADSDDILIGGEYLRKVAEISLRNGFDCVFFTYYYGVVFDGEPKWETIKHVDLVQKRERLLKPHLFTWKGMLHETPVPTENYQLRYTYVPYSQEYPIVWLHTEAERDPKSQRNVERMARNKRILEKQLEQEKLMAEGADPRTILYLMKIYVEMEDSSYWQKCLEMGREYLEKSGWDEERAVCWSLMARAASLLGDDKLAVTYTLSAIQEYPYSSVLYLYLSKYYLNDGHIEKAEYWLEEALNVKERDTTQMNNELEKKMLAGEIAYKIYFFHKKDVRTTLRIIKYLHSISPTEQTAAILKEVSELANLDLACENVHRLFKYCESIKEEGRIPQLYFSLPEKIRSLEFAVYYKNKYTYRVWGKDEICYYATYGGAHIEKWSPESLKTGIGGSETAVIKLSREWVKHGYKVTVYADTCEPLVYDGVVWLPYYYFNQRDRFNIFIQWRMATLAGKVKCKKFLVDMHDVYSPLSIDWSRIDALMVKSRYHRNIASSIADEKFRIISNGV